MTNQQELELLAEWLGIHGRYRHDVEPPHQHIRTKDGHCWNPLTNDTDFLNMVAGRVDFDFGGTGVMAVGAENYDISSWKRYHDHNNDKVAAMKHVAYQVCLMAAKEWKGLQ